MSKRDHVENCFVPPCLLDSQDGFTLLGNTAAGEGTCTVPLLYASSSQPLHPRDAVSRGSAKTRTWGMTACGAGEQTPPCSPSHPTKAHHNSQNK